MGSNDQEQPPALDEGTHPSPTELEHLRILVRAGATINQPAFGVDFGELNYRTLGRLVARRLVIRRRLYLYGENRTRTGYWPTLAGRGALLVGGAKPSTTDASQDQRSGGTPT